MEFGDILKQLRQERGLSQEELAARLGTTKQVISRYETKKRIPRLSVVSDYAQKLGVPLSALSGEAPIVPAGAIPVGGHRRVPILGAVACGEPIYSPGDGTDFVSVEDDLACDFLAGGITSAFRRWVGEKDRPSAQELSRRVRRLVRSVAPERRDAPQS